jgi:hypothetical protein
MPEKFHQRFKMEVPSEVAQDRFVARVGNEIFSTGNWWTNHADEIKRVIATALGERLPSR